MGTTTSRCMSRFLRLRSSWLRWISATLLLLCSPPLSTISSSSKNNIGVAAADAPSSSASPRGNETERLSLLAFRDGIVGVGGPVGGALSSWNDSLHHCRWRGVGCGSRRHPGRVTALDLASFKLTGYISPSIANLTFLWRIDFSNNHIYGTIPPQLGALHRLRYLNLTQNTIIGAMPSNLSSCIKLQKIDLSRNQLVGEIPATFGSLPNLQYLNIGYNYITGAIPTSLGNLSSGAFNVLELGDNLLRGRIPSEMGRLTNLVLLGAFRNELSGAVPPSIYNLSNIQVINLYQNKLSGTLPPDLGIALPELWFLTLDDNLFEGNIPNALANASSLQTIQLGDNQFRGTIPDNLGALKDLQVFFVTRNRLEVREHRDWNFLTSLTNCTRLRELSLQSNDIRGTLPTSIANLSSGLEKLFININQISGSIPEGIESYGNLKVLSMGYNLFHGAIPPVLGKLTNLEGLSLRNNQLSGEIPSELGKLANLEGLALENNQLSGEIPSELANATLLSHLHMGGNNLSGSIPMSLGRYQRLSTLDVSANSLSGMIPNELFMVFTLVAIDMSNNFLEGSLPSDVEHTINIQFLNLSNNRLSGYLPSSLGSWENMEQLYLSSNSFQGPLPSSLKVMKGIKELDLSLNKFTGRIPEFLQDFALLRYLNLSFNDFIGEVPKHGIFTNATAISLSGNKMICGGIPALRLPKCKSQDENKGNHSHLLKVIVSTIVAGFSLLLFLCFIIYLHQMRKSKGKGPNASTLEVGHKNISYHDLVKATDGFSQSNLIGTGSFGFVYKGIMDDEEIVAVKVLNIQRTGALKSFKSECEALRNIRHRNLMKIISVCSSIDSSGNDFKALVFEFFPNGSLEKWLHPEPEEMQTRILDFAQRLSIAIDVASALDYLHTHCHTPIVHCDLKPSNVLLDCNMTAHVGDFGLARFILNTSTENRENQSSTIGIKGSIGYIAPEYGSGNPVSVDGDIYSFGNLLLELFTGTRPTDDMFRDGLSLQKLVEAALSEQVMNIIDPYCLLPLNSGVDSFQNARRNIDNLLMERMQKCFVSLMKVGLNCTKETPQERMRMGAVVKEIQLIQRAYLEMQP